MKPSTTSHSALLCPTDASHGPLTLSGTGRLMCPHQGHDGRPATHPQGSAEQTAMFFSLDAAEEAQRERLKA